MSHPVTGGERDIHQGEVSGDGEGGTFPIILDIKCIKKMGKLNGI